MRLFQSVKGVFRNKALHTTARGSVHSDNYVHSRYLKFAIIGPSSTMFTCINVVSLTHDMNLTKNIEMKEK